MATHVTIPTHATLARLIRAAVGRGDEPIGVTLDPTTHQPQPRSVFTIERTGRRFEIEVTELPEGGGDAS